MPFSIRSDTEQGIIATLIVAERARPFPNVHETMKRKVERYLRTGHFDDLKLPARWDGYFERAKAERTVLR